MNDWSAVEEDIRCIVAAETQDPFASETIAQVADFLKVAREWCPVPNDVCKGYWSTISFTWMTTSLGPLEVEIWADRFETYRFFDGRTDIREFRHAPGTNLPDEFVKELPFLCEDQTRREG